MGITIGFEFSMTDSVDEMSAGIDNLHLTAYGLCSSRRTMVVKSSATEGKVGLAGGFGIGTATSATAATAAQAGGSGDGRDNLLRAGVANEPDAYGDDGNDGPYCVAEDFPCNGGDMVYVCHYSGRRGYQTFCIPENDSDILRFYPKDYCGPCVGGYGGLNW